MTYDLAAETDKFLCDEKIYGERELHYYPSEASVSYTDASGKTIVHGTCLRQAFFRCKGYARKDFPAKAQYIFELGKYSENMLLENCPQKIHIEHIPLSHSIAEDDLFTVLSEASSVPLLIFSVMSKTCHTEAFHQCIEFIGNQKT